MRYDPLNEFVWSRLWLDAGRVSAVVEPYVVVHDHEYLKRRPASARAAACMRQRAAHLPHEGRADAEEQPDRARPRVVAPVGTSRCWPYIRRAAAVGRFQRLVQRQKALAHTFLRRHCCAFTEGVRSVRFPRGRFSHHPAKRAPRLPATRATWRRRENRQCRRRRRCAHGCSTWTRPTFAATPVVRERSWMTTCARFSASRRARRRDARSIVRDWQAPSQCAVRRST